MRLVTANIKNNPVMPQPRVVSDCATAKSRGTVIGWQEIGYARYKDAVKHAGREPWDHCQLDLDIPISVKAKYYTIKKNGHRMTHHGRAGASPNRYLTWAFVERKGVGDKFVVVNTHFVSGAWNNKPKLFKRWRKRMWNTHYAILKETVLGFHQAGYTVLGTGDYNRTDVEKFHPQQRWIANRGIDKLWVLEGANGPSVEELSHHVVHINSDHDLQVGALRMRPRS